MEVNEVISHLTASLAASSLTYPSRYVLEREKSKMDSFRFAASTVIVYSVFSIYSLSKKTGTPKFAPLTVCVSTVNRTVAGDINVADST